MADSREMNALQLLLPTERELIEKIRALPAQPSSKAFLTLAAMRLRNIREKYAEECRRDALKHASRAPRPACRKLEICSAALEECRKRLAAIGDES